MTKDLIKNLRKKDVKTISKLISTIENEDKGYLDSLSDIHSYIGNAYRIGITGPPGSGKSSLTNQLIEQFIKKDYSIAIIAIDPSSPFNGGSILGDRIRFTNTFKNSDIFFRSMSTRGSQGGLSRSATLVADIFDASGYDIIIFETVGVGQVEIDVIEAADTIMVTLVPESGDDIQMMKSGLMEIADLYIINKSDRDGSDRLYNSLNKILELNKDSDWNPTITKTSAISGLGIDELFNRIMEHKVFIEENDIKSEKMDERYIKIVNFFITESLTKNFWNSNKVLIQRLEKELKVDYKKRLSPYKIAKELLEK
ncbi:MAG: methylmalonyl Co-A mutase-associated GTPase MeaB [Candidatus Marinimicrobia bacterium]|nr:methylmalonyl Co-A mutase-associated GTPase MeaB [Candidatus Neomarinimicrobiota bacterium]